MSDADHRRVVITPAAFDRADARVALGLASLALILFARATGFGFVSFDDPVVLLAHPNLFDERSLLASMREIFVGYFPREEPLLIRDVSWAIDARLFGFRNPFGYHAANVVLHALNTSLLYLLLRRWLGRRLLAAGVAAAFAVVPVHVEPVAWVMGRKDLLAAAFCLAALLCQSFEISRSPETAAPTAGADRSPRRRRALYLAGLGCLVLAMFSKASAVVLFAVLAFHRICSPYLEGQLSPTVVLPWWPRVRSAALACAPHFAASVAFFLWYRGVTQAYGVVQEGGPGPLDPEHLANMLRFGPLILGQYLAHLVWPAELSMYYRWPHVELPLSVPMLALSALLASLLIGALVALRRRRDLIFFGWFPLVLLLPYAGFFYVGFWSADRYVYLASAGVLVLAGTLLHELAARGSVGRAIAALAAVAFLLGSTVKTWQHLPVWQDDASLWSYEAYRTEPSLLGIQALARSYMKRAEVASSPVDRQQWLRRASAEIARGFARERELGRVPGRYGVPETLHLARLHYLRGRVSELSGSSIDEQLVHYQRAFALAPERLTALYLSRGLAVLAQRRAEPERRRLVEHSFDYFVQYLAMSRSDPLQLAEGRALLERNYQQRYPYLDDRIEAARRTYIQ